MNMDRSELSSPAALSHGAGDGREQQAYKTYVDSLGWLSERLMALNGLPARLRLVADACQWAAEAAAECHALGFGPGAPKLRMAGWEHLPAELTQVAPRPGEPGLWQALDRSLARLQAVLDDPDLSLDVHAAAYAALSDACQELSAGLSDPRPPWRADDCWLCGAEMEEREQIIAGEWAAICNQCISLCNDVLARGTDSADG
jgi:hypothetical protein